MRARRSDNSAKPPSQPSLAARRRQELLRVRRMRLISVIYALGPRPIAELILELDRVYGFPDLDCRLERYAALDPQVLKQLGADQLPPLPVHAVRR